MKNQNKKNIKFIKFKRSSGHWLLAIVTFLPLFDSTNNSYAATIKYLPNTLIAENLETEVEEKALEENPVREYTEALDEEDLIERYKKNSSQNQNKINSDREKISSQPVKNIPSQSNDKKALTPLPVSRSDRPEQCEQYSPIGKVAQERKSSVYIVPQTDFSSIFKGIYDYESNPECQESANISSSSTRSGSISQSIAQSMLAELDILNYSKIGTKVFTPQEYIRPLAQTTATSQTNLFVNPAIGNYSIDLVQTLGDLPQNSSVANTTYLTTKNREKAVAVYSSNNIITKTTTPAINSSNNYSAQGVSAVAKIPISETEQQIQATVAAQREKDRERQKEIMKKIKKQLEEREKIKKKQQEEMEKRRENLAKKQLLKQKEQVEKIQELARQ
jgi:hypothetical protein